LLHLVHYFYFCPLGVSFRGHISLTLYINYPNHYFTHAQTQLVETLHYNPKSRGFDSRWCHWNSGRTMALELTQTLAEMNTRNIS